MSVKIVRRKLKHSLPFADVRDQQLKDALMKIGENFAQMQSQVETLQSAVEELQRRK